MSADLVTLTFCVALVGGLAVQTWLSSRQIRHVWARREQVPEAFAATVTPQAHRKAADYTVARSRFGMLQRLIGAALLLGWTLLGGLDALNAWVADWAYPALGAMGYQLALLAAFVIVSAVLDLPGELYSNFVLEQRFGFNRMSLRLWWSDQLKAALLGTVIGLPLAALVLWIMGRSAGQWWWWAWLAWVGFNLLLLLIYPTVIAPMFNRFEPLRDVALAERVQALMRRNGFAAKGLFVMDGSRRSAHANAYFTGLGRSKRVVFYDTLLQRLSPAELEAVLAHELGHFHHRHVLKRMVFVFAASGLALALLGWLCGQSGFYRGLGVQPNLALPNDALALLLFALALPCFSFFISPVTAWMSRRDEFEADAFAARATGCEDLSRALVKLHEDNAATLTPDPVFARFYYSHPPAAQRLSALRVAAQTAPAAA